MIAVRKGELLVLSRLSDVHAFHVGQLLGDGLMVRAIDYEHNAIYLWEATPFRRLRHLLAFKLVTAAWNWRCMWHDIWTRTDEQARNSR